MTNDIVARLRIWSDNAKEQDATDIVVGLCEAADEIERLRAGGCMRDQTTTQFCSEAAALQAEVERLRAQIEATELKLREQTAKSVEAAFQIRALVRQLNPDDHTSSPQ